MLPVLSAEQMRAFDRRAIEVLGVSSLTLMETAGRSATEVILAWQAEGAVIAPCLVVAGAGNNAGDGFVVARRLLSAGVEVETFLTAPAAKLSGDAQTNLDALRAAGGKLSQLEGDVAALATALSRAGLAVDALFGTGLDREITGFLAQVIDAFNAAPCRKL
ncbi:MAG TPA: NAD(P)H-hydrate epimerase, partial [Polyangiaceae bacterium]|nr:NAD(P)H-hydrate epimerase [Polyangiaceae bacterium]